MTRNAKILVISLIVLVAVSAVVAYLMFYAGFPDWLVVVSVIFSGIGVFIMERLAIWISKIWEEPRLKIMDSVKELHAEGSEGEYLEIFLILKNVGGKKADDYEVKAMVEGVSKEFYYITHNPFLLVADDTRKILFQQIIKSEQTTQSLTEGSPRLSRGKIYTFKIRFLGSNFKDKKLHTLKLDLSSWENIKVILDC